MRSVISAIALLVLPASAAAQGVAIINVTLGAAVQARSHELGPEALTEQQSDLQHAVQQSVRRSPAPIQEVDLAIVDLEPNRPTSAQLGRSTQLSETSFGLGGAAVTGQVVYADGSKRPIRFRHFPTELRNELANDTWADAGIAYQELAHDLASGKAPDDESAWPPPHRARTLTGTRIPG